MAERPKAAVLKTARGASPSWVRIPVPPHPAIVGRGPARLGAGPLPLGNCYLCSIDIDGRWRNTVLPLRLLKRSATECVPGATFAKAHKNECACAKVTSCAENCVSVGLQLAVVPSSPTDTNTRFPLPVAKLNAATWTTRHVGADPPTATDFVIPGTAT